MHIQYDECTRRDCPESTHCPGVKDQWDCALDDLQELGNNEFLVLTRQYNIEIFPCCLRLLPSCSSTFHQTNIESAQIRSEEHLSFSTESTISTSLIHSIASVGNCEQVHTSSLESYLPTSERCGRGEFAKTRI